MTEYTNGNLMVSETGLLIVNDSEFYLHTKEFIDYYIDYAVSLITDIFYNLYRRNILVIDTNVKVYKFLKLQIWTKEQYSVRLNEVNFLNYTLGWFEERIISTVGRDSTIDLDNLFSRIFSLIFKEGKGTCVNPGRLFFKYALENQKHNLFSFEIHEGFWNDKIKVWQDSEQLARYNRIQATNWVCEVEYFDIGIFWDKTKRELIKYIDNGG